MADGKFVSIIASWCLFCQIYGKDPTSLIKANILVNFLIKEGVAFQYQYSPGSVKDEPSVLITVSVDPVLSLSWMVKV